MPDTCRYLEWDSEFFGFHIARVDSHRLTAESVSDILQWCRFRRIRCLYFCADIDDTDTVILAEDNGFRLVDLRITFEIMTGRFPPLNGHTAKAACRIRPSQPQDTEDLKSIARNAYSMTRFHSDSGFPAEKSNQMYEVWIEKSCNGYADAVLVAEGAGLETAGYITCRLNDTGSGNIGLLGVAPDFQGSGIATSLLNASFEWFAHQNASRIEVVTQGRNYPAIRLYQKAGFQLQSIRFWYHRWFTRETDCNV